MRHVSPVACRALSPRLQAHSCWKPATPLSSLRASWLSSSTRAEVPAKLGIVLLKFSGKKYRSLRESKILESQHLLPSPVRAQPLGTQAPSCSSSFLNDSQAWQNVMISLVLILQTNKVVLESNFKNMKLLPMMPVSSKEKL